MPYEIKKDLKACPASRPWAVRNEDTGDVNGRCFASHDEALPQQRLLMVRERRTQQSAVIGGLMKPKKKRKKGTPGGTGY